MSSGFREENYMGDYSSLTGRHRERPMPALVDKLWRVLGPSNKRLVCCLYFDEAGLELRAH